MHEEPCNILAINPGTRYLGVAVFIGTELRDWAVRILHGKKIQEVVSEYVSRYGVCIIVLKKLHPSRSSRNLRHLVAEITKMISRHKLALCEFSIDEVKKFLCPKESINKRRVMEEVAARFPFLYPDLEREKKNRNPYLVRMFEAVALGLAAVSETDTRCRKVGRMK